ncbi:solute carrier family 52, riboflavin transporter, member 3 [Anopheles bellator]|uniref:solute carrier family 52, riboflavin transporter, member 3 n=1 Tax=Anopheles bellator TaxID=139047 RepID=UPI002647489A|nr:solute carrier family 52, riboflavin transporter, member 3 [Anopheles bellator]
MGARKPSNDRRFVVDLLAIVFGIGSWIGVNSVYVQLPLLVQSAPEGWNLPSFLVVTIQLGNVGPILYTATQRWRSFRDANLIIALLLLGSGATLATAFAHDQTVVVFGEPHSVPLFITVFVVALVGCTSSVLFMPYMGRFKDIYLITYLIGEGLSGFLPSILALGQGVGGNAECVLVNDSIAWETPVYESYTPPPRFGTNVYFIISSALLLVSLVAFVLLDRWDISIAEHAAVTIGNGNNYTYEASDKTVSTGTAAIEAGEKRLPTVSYWLLMLLIGGMCLFGNGFFPSIQSYSCLPYGNVAYHLAVTLSSMANPAACFLGFFVRRNTVRLNVLLAVLFVPFAAYAMTTAITSPAPPLMHHTIGDILVISCWTVLIGLISYIRLSITTLLRREGGQTLVWVGVASQMGSLAGSLLSFGLVNFTDSFEQYYPC